LRKHLEQIGDVFSATTHFSIYMPAVKAGVKVEVIHNASILTAIGLTGLSLYKFGKVTSIPFERTNVISPYETLLENNQKHTLFLLDLDPKNNKFLRINEAIEYLLKFKDGSFTEDSLCVGCEKLGGENKITVGSAKELLGKEFDGFPQCLIVPGSLHFTEEEFLELWKDI